MFTVGGRARATTCLHRRDDVDPEPEGEVAARDDAVVADLGVRLFVVHGGEEVEDDVDQEAQVHRALDPVGLGEEVALFFTGCPV